VRSRSLFTQTALTVAVTLVAFMVLSMSAAAYFVYVPLSKRYADDFAAVIVSAAHSLQSLPENMHAELRRQLLQDHGIIVAEETSDLSTSNEDIIYETHFHDALARRAGQDLAIYESETSPLIWVDVPAHGKLFRLGFDGKRLGVNPPVVLLLALVGGALTVGGGGREGVAFGVLADRAVGGKARRQAIECTFTRPEAMIGRI